MRLEGNAKKLKVALEVDQEPMMFIHRHYGKFIYLYYLLLAPARDTESPVIAESNFFMWSESLNLYEQNKFGIYA